MLARGWVEPTHGSRELRVTPTGQPEIICIAAQLAAATTKIDGYGAAPTSADAHLHPAEQLAAGELVRHGWSSVCLSFMMNSACDFKRAKAKGATKDLASRVGGDPL